MKDIGVLAPIVTPCTLNGNLDHEGLKAVCDYMLEPGCSAVFVVSSTGRGPWFSMKQRIDICKTVVEHVGSKVAVFAGCMATGLENMLENARAMADTGAQIAVVTAPGYFTYSNEEVEKIFLKVADKSPLPVLIYDIPEFVGIKLEEQTIMRLVMHDNIIGIKDSSGDFDHFKILSSAFQNKPNSILLQGKELFLAQSLKLGVSGFVVSLVHLSPKIFNGLYRAVRRGDYALADEIQKKVTNVLRIYLDCFKKRPSSSTLFHFLNAVLCFRGICKNILMDHEGGTPGWIIEKARNVIRELDA